MSVDTKGKSDEELARWADQEEMERAKLQRKLFKLFATEPENVLAPLRFQHDEHARRRDELLAVVRRRSQQRSRDDA